MITIDVRNVNNALLLGYNMLREIGHRRESRNGPVYILDGPVTTLYNRPKERVLFWPERDANPYFHFMEGLWMIGGRNDVDFVSQFVKNMINFSDDGVTFHGAYGHRWRHHFGGDQLHLIADLLRADRNDRRIVLQMWDPRADLGQQGKDFPCNLEILFRISVHGNLDMTVFNRSNDVIWGAYGANAVHMSMLQEFMAAWIGVPMGRYWQISNNFHGYDEIMTKHVALAARPIDELCPYQRGLVEPYQMVDTDINTWQQDLGIFLDEGPIVGFKSKFFRKVVTPIFNSWQAYKADDKDAAMEIIKQCAASDWRAACEDWLIRRGA